MKNTRNMDRLFKSGLITTILGAALCIGAFILYSINKPMEESVVVFGWGLTFLRSKDSLIGINPKEDK